MADRGLLRSITVGSKREFKKELLEWEGNQFEIRQPSVRQRSEILKKARMTVGDDEGVSVDIAAMQVWSVICCVYAPDDTKPLFSDGDFESLLDMPAGSFVDKFATVAMSYINTNVEEVEKNLEAVQTDKSSIE